MHDRNQEWLSHDTGEIEEPDGFEGRYDHHEPLHTMLEKAYLLREECRAQNHKLGQLKMNLATNVMSCSRCAESWDLNELVSPELQVKRWVA